MGRRRRTARVRPVDGRGTDRLATCRRDSSPRLPRGQEHPPPAATPRPNQLRHPRDQHVNHPSTWLTATTGPPAGLMAVDARPVRGRGPDVVSQTGRTDGAGRSSIPAVRPALHPRLARPPRARGPFDCRLAVGGGVR
jgi:hypothetical protein